MKALHQPSAATSSPTRYQSFSTSRKAQRYAQTPVSLRPQLLGGATWRDGGAAVPEILELLEISGALAALAAALAWDTRMLSCGPRKRLALQQKAPLPPTEAAYAACEAVFAAVGAAEAAAAAAGGAAEAAPANAAAGAAGGPTSGGGRRPSPWLLAALMRACAGVLTFSVRHTGAQVLRICGKVVPTPADLRHTARVSDGLRLAATAVEAAATIAKLQQAAAQQQTAAMALPHGDGGGGDASSGSAAGDAGIVESLLGVFDLLSHISGLATHSALLRDTCVALAAAAMADPVARMQLAAGGGSHAWATKRRRRLPAPLARQLAAPMRWVAEAAAGRTVELPSLDDDMAPEADAGDNRAAAAGAEAAAKALLEVRIAQGFQEPRCIRQAACMLATA